MHDRLKISILTAAAALLAGMAQAGDYKVTGTHCKGNDCTSHVRKDDHWGEIVTGKGRKATERKAQKLADEKNKEAKESESEETEKEVEEEGGGYWDPCSGGQGAGGYGC
ncbi:hypothetical protein [Vannielia litorea]|uniref:hypothetical protein n=1 Tax=Vannielia litorea TaxID=1217970 RepID=UPI001BCE144E|nr:hypothetical protein [Vannielia litorea]MBS8228913.1 hypothetical protein [Vannielia litorea]